MNPSTIRAMEPVNKTNTKPPPEHKQEQTKACNKMLDNILYKIDMTQEEQDKSFKDEIKNDQNTPVEVPLYRITLVWLFDKDGEFLIHWNSFFVVGYLKNCSFFASTDFEYREGSGFGMGGKTTSLVVHRKGL